MFIFPDCIWLKIFSFIDKIDLIACSRVSRKWYQICYDRSLWKTVSSTEFAEYNIEIQNDKTLKGLLRNFNLVNLDLSDCINLSNRSIMNAAFHSAKLSILNLNNCRNITDRAITTIAMHCKKLTEVNLSQTRVTEKGLGQLFSENLLLKDVTVNPSALTENSLNTLALHCKSLSVLVAETFSFSDNKACLTASMLAVLALNCFDLSILILRYPVINIDDLSLSLLGHYCNKLECIEIEHIYYHSEISDRGLINLCKPLKKLCRLVISNTCATDLTLHAVSKSNLKLEHLGIKFCQKTSDAGIINLVQSCEFLESLTIGCGWNGELTNLSALAVANAKCSRNLLRLDMYGWGINDYGLFLLSQNLPKLLNLSLEHCPFITKNGLFAFLQSHPKLLSLDLSSTNCLENDEDLLELGILIPNLTLLNINQCRTVSFAAINEFRKVFPICEVIAEHFMDMS